MKNVPSPLLAMGTTWAMSARGSQSQSELAAGSETLEEIAIQAPDVTSSGGVVAEGWVGWGDSSARARRHPTGKVSSDLSISPDLPSRGGHRV